MSFVHKPMSNDHMCHFRFQSYLETIEMTFVVNNFAFNGCFVNSLLEVIILIVLKIATASHTYKAVFNGCRQEATNTAPFKTSA